MKVLHFYLLLFAVALAACTGGGDKFCEDTHRYRLREYNDAYEHTPVYGPECFARCRRFTAACSYGGADGR